LAAQGVTVVLQDRSLFQQWGQSFSRVGLEFVRREVSPGGDVNAISCLCTALQLFSDRPRVCIEIALMAADSGALLLDEDCIAIACPSSYCGLPDAGVVMRPAKSEDIFKGCLRIKEVILRPASDDVWFSDKPLP
jgi:hypothetical protein